MELGAECEIISIPTAHVWGSQDTLWPGRALALSEICSSNMRTVYIHDGGHEVPGSKSKAAVTGTVHAIRKTIDQALSTIRSRNFSSSIIAQYEINT